MEAATDVIEVKYGDSAKVVDAGTDLMSMRLLTEKIFSLLNFAPDTEIMLTYTDKDGASVALVDDDDLRNVAKQSLNPLKITVKLKAEKICRSPKVKLLFEYPDAQVSKMLKGMPEPTREKYEKLWTESKNSDWSQVETVVKVVPSARYIMSDRHERAAASSSSNATKKSPTWLYIVAPIRKKLVPRIRYGIVRYEFEDY